MLISIGILVLGAVVGVFMRNNPTILKLNSKATEYSIFALLFILGTGVGSNPQILNNIGKIGLSVVLITTFAIAGSVIFAFLVYKFMFKER